MSIQAAHLTPGQLKTLAARSARTRSKHLRWAAELAVAGWWVVEAAPITLNARAYNDESVDLGVDCVRCSAVIGVWNSPYSEVIMPLPEVLAKVNGHVCEEKR